MIQRASTRLERYRYLVQELQISWNIQISIKFSFPSSAPISYHRRKALPGISVDFLPHYFFSLYAFYPLFSPISFPFLFLSCYGCWYPFYCLITGRPCYAFPYEKEGLTVFLIQIFTSHLAVNTLQVTQQVWV